MTSLACPACAGAVQQDDLICFSCGANLPWRGPDDETTPPTIRQEFLRREHGTSPAPAALRCPRCGSSIPDASLLACPLCHGPLPRGTGPISAVVLRLTFPTGNVDVPAGTSLVLGRDPAESLVAAAFADYENVSRRHATVSVNDTGQATIRDEYSTNGTFVNGDRVLPGNDIPLADGDEVRLAASITGRVSLPPPETEAAPFNSNGWAGPR
jgi:hypothetical protein